MLTITQITEWRARQLEELVSGSEAEGFRFLKRLQEEWLSGVNRFSRTGEAFFGVFEHGCLVAVGGINRESYDSGRLRRFYVRKQNRRRGIGRMLVQHILGFAANHYARVHLRTDNDAADRFYVSLGFNRLQPNEASTHLIEIMVPRSQSMSCIETLTEERVDWISREFTRLAWNKSPGYFRLCFEAQQKGDLAVLVARADEVLQGYLKIVWTPDYDPFRERCIPEIQDLNVVPAARRRGVASRLMDAAEEIIHERSSVVGIGVGLHPGYAAAQRMYVLRGYVPDARPLTYRNQFVNEGQQVPLDDDLVLHLTKELR